MSSMDSYHSAPEIASYVSNQSGSVPSSSYSIQDSDNESSTQKQTAGVMEVNDNKDISISVNGAVGDGGSENDGFVSGDVESETPAERPILVYSDEKSAEGEVVRASFGNSEEFFTPRAGRPNGKASVDDDNHEESVVGDSGGDISGSDNLEQGGGGNLYLVGEVTAEKLGTGAATGGYEEEVVQTESIRESEFNDSQEKFVEDSESGEVKGSMPSVIEGGMVAAQNGVEFHNLKDEEAMKEPNNEILYDSQQAIPMEADSCIQVVKAGNTQTGDSVVDNLQVNLLPSGAAVVGDREDISDSAIKGIEAASSGITLDNGFDPIEEPLDKFATSDAKSDPNVTNLVDDDTKQADKGVHIAPLEKGGNLDFESHSVDTEVKPLHHGINIEAFAIDGETGTKHAEERLHIASLEEGEKLDLESSSADAEVKAPQDDTNLEDHANEGQTGCLVDTSSKSLTSESVDPNLCQSQAIRQDEDDEEKCHPGVGDREDNDDSEIKGMVAPASGISLDNGFDPIEQDVEEPLDKFATSDAKSDQNVTNLIDDDTKHADKGTHSAPLEKGGNLNTENHSVDPEVKPLQDGINVEAFVNNGEIGTKHAEKGLHIASLEKGEKLDFESHSVDAEVKAPQDDTNLEVHANVGETGCHVDASGESLSSESVDPNASRSQAIRQDGDDEEKHHSGSGEIGGSVSDGEADCLVFRSSGAAQRFLEELEQHSGAESSQEASQRIDGQIVTDSDEEVDTDEEGDGKELFDSAALTALLKAATGVGQDGSNITVTSQDGSRLFSVERPAGLGRSLQSVKPAAQPNHVSLFTPSNPRAGADSDSNLSEEEKKKLEKVQQLRIKFLRLVQRLGFTPPESIAAQVLYRLTLVAGRQSSQLFSLDDAKRSASQLEAEGRDDLEFSLNILVIGKTGMGKSATINSIYGETKTNINAYGPATSAVTEIVGVVDGVKIRIFDTPGLKSSALEQNFNRKVLSMVKKFTKKSPPDIVLYVDRLDVQTRNLNDLPLLKSVTNVLGPSIWQSAIVTLTHAASAPPDGPSGSPLGYDVFVAQRSHIVQQSIGQAVGDLRLMNPSLTNPVSLVENHCSCRKNRDGEKVLPNGQSWRLHLLLLCYSMKILSEAGNLSKTQDKFDHQRLFGFHVRSPPLPYLLSCLLQSHTHPKLSADQGGDNGDSDIELADLSDSDLDEDQNEYDQLPPFKPLRKSQIAKLSREQRKAYFEEYDYRVKLVQKKQWREELKRMREMKKKGKTNVNDYSYMEEEDQENGSPAAVPVPLPDMVLLPSFDSDNPAYRYRFLEPTSQLLIRPVLDTHGWDHDCGYDGVNLEHSLAIINQFPAAVSVQITKDKKDFTIHLDSSVATKHGENGSTMAGFDIQNIGKQLAYILRGETKFKTFKRNKTAAGVSVTFLGENVSTGLKLEDQIALGKHLVLVGSTGTVRSQDDSAYGANVEVRLREADFPIGQDQSSLGVSLVKWRGDLALGANFQSQFSLGRSYKMAVRAGLNNKLSGQITVRTSSSDQLQIALLAILPIARAIYKSFWPGASENYAIY